MSETGVYEHQQSIGRNYYGNYAENQLEVVHLCVSICLYIYIAFNHRIDPLCFLLFLSILHV